MARHRANVAPTHARDGSSVNVEDARDGCPAPSFEVQPGASAGRPPQACTASYKRNVLP